jgi:hypothetical protein
VTGAAKDLVKKRYIPWQAQPELVFRLDVQDDDKVIP